MITSINSVYHRRLAEEKHSSSLSIIFSLSSGVRSLRQSNCVLHRTAAIACLTNLTSSCCCCRNVWPSWLLRICFWNSPQIKKNVVVTVWARSWTETPAFAALEDVSRPTQPTKAYFFPGLLNWQHRWSYKAVLTLAQTLRNTWKKPAKEPKKRRFQLVRSCIRFHDLNGSMKHIKRKVLPNCYRAEIVSAEMAL